MMLKMNMTFEMQEVLEEAVREAEVVEEEGTAHCLDL